MPTLTVKTIQAAQPKAKRHALTDPSCPGLSLVIQTSGVKSWVWRAKVGGVTQKHTLGRFPAHGLADAREWAANLTRSRDGGIDPRAERQASLAAAKADASKAAMTVSRAFDIYMEREGDSRKSAAEKRRLFDKDIALMVGARNLFDIDHDDLAAVIDAKFRYAPTTSNRLYSLIKRFFNWCMTKGRTETRLRNNPAQHLVKLADENQRDRFLSGYEIGLFLKSLEALDHRFANAFKLLLLTGTRLSEVVRAEWSEFDLEKAEWLIPAKRSKNGKPHLVPLAPMALAVVASLTRTERSDFLFPSHRLGSRNPISGDSAATVKLRARMIELAARDGKLVEHWQLHDLRHTFATHLNQITQQPHLVEALLNHVSGFRAGVAGRYNHYLYQEEKKAALSRWETFISALI